MANLKKWAIKFELCFLFLTKLAYSYYCVFEHAILTQLISKMYYWVLKTNMILVFAISIFKH